MTTMPPRKLFQEMLRRSFHAFACRAFLTLNPGQTFIGGHYLQMLAWHLERVACGELRRVAFVVPPRHLKSHLGSVAFPAWLLGLNPTTRIIAASYGSELAQTFSLQTRKLMEEQWYRRTFPRTILDPARANLAELRTTRHGYRIATSVGGTLTGRGGDILIIDDPLKASDAGSETIRTAANNWYRESLISRQDDPRTGAIVVLVQRLHSDDIIGQLKDIGGYTIIELPVIAATHQTFPLAPGVVWKRHPGDLLHPERMGPDELDQLRREVGSAAYQAMYLCDPEQLSGNLVLMEWFPRYHPEELPRRFEAIVQSVDPALTPGEGNDWSVITTWGILGQRLYLIDVFRRQLLFPDLLKAVVQLRERYRADMVVIEDIGIGTAVAQTLQRDGASWVAFTRPHGSKEHRLVCQTTKIEAGHIYLPTVAPWLDAFEREVMAFPHGRHDDQVDSMTLFLHALDQRPYRLRHVEYVRSLDPHRR